MNTPDSDPNHGENPSNENGLVPTHRSPIPTTVAIPETRTKRPIARTLTIVALVTAGLLVASAFVITWVLYRHDHTVIRQATVKGRLHRMGARIDAQVKSIEVVSGQRIEKGQVLVRLEDHHIQAALRRTQSELHAALRRIEAEKLAIEHDRRRLTLEVEKCQTLSQVAAADMEGALSIQQKLDREFDRLTSLNVSGISSASEIDRVRSDRDNARAFFKSAQGSHAVAEVNCRASRVQLEGLQVREAAVGVLEAEAERMRQQVAAAEADLAATVIRAPEAGWVAERIMEPGGSAQVGDPIIILWLGQPWIEAWADEKRLTQIKVGSPVDVSLAAFSGRKLNGRVESIGVLSDKEIQQQSIPATLHSFFSRNAKIPIRIAVPGDEVRLQPGLSALVGIRDPNRHATAAARRMLDNVLALRSAIFSESVAKSK